MYSLSAIDTVHLAPASNLYIYDVLSLSSGLITLCSDDTIRLLDPHALSGACRVLKDVGESVTCFKPIDNDKLVAVAGRNGTINIWDVRGGRSNDSGCLAGQVRADDNSAILSVASCSPFGLAGGSELSNHQASIFLWDLRKLGTPLVKYEESHSDDITELQTHPVRSDILLSGSIDGLLNIFNINITDEDEALHQTINHGASIHHSNFLSDVDIFALSHDEKFSVYGLLTNPDEFDKESRQIHFHDMRDKLGGEYVAKVIGRPDGGAVMGSGAHSRETFDLVQLKNNPPWSFAPEEKVTLCGAHGTDIVRSFCFLDTHHTVFTCGEDGQVKAWRGDQ
ncbi:hypothetical protein K3495_g4976 [Podosphaera aphanis]|nr:hypothetical protein K3495_g4976 [Podosphaera aphanis]